MPDTKERRIGKRVGAEVNKINQTPSNPRHHKRMTSAMINTQFDTKIETFNHRGLLINAEQVAELIKKVKLGFLTITETWIKPEKAMPLNFIHKSIFLPCNSYQKRGNGGVSLIFHPMIPYRLLSKHGEAEF